ncbi:hypothetical protein I6G97_10525 [Edwardsiella hoshinae]|uniref:Uncharacterized protein n=1 Tax=Edwardsiella hoshinae TaxID=93378 RepID=A0A376DHU0_9GAMM|nr:hypothetical protein [Edwardsiella hoshinae]QPR26899.1 hypothetical protein I6G97_10525 [Edwardsiella hoshinae]STC89112.1 Uncharacterised protein [Edwardsiella hoshinae]
MKRALIALVALCAAFYAGIRADRFLMQDACLDAGGRIQGIFCERG